MKRFLKYTTEEQLKAVKKNPHVIRFFHDASEELKLLAVQRDGLVIQYFHNPSEELQLAAVQQNPEAIKYIVDYYDSIAKITTDKDYLNLKN